MLNIGIIYKIGVLEMNTAFTISAWLLLRFHRPATKAAATPEDVI